MAASTVVVTQEYKRGNVKGAVITATASSTAATFLAKTLGDLGLEISQTGGTLLAIATNPGSTAPTANYDITLVDGDGLDRLNGTGNNRHTTNSERAAITGTPVVYPGEVLTLTFANNAVNSAVVVVTLYWTNAPVGVAVLSDLDTLIGQLPPALGGGGGLKVQPPAPVFFTWTPTIDTSAYATGDSLYTTVTTIASVAAANGGVFLLDYLTVLDLSTPSGVATPSALDVLFFNASITPSAANAASAISDGDMALCIGHESTGPYTTGTVNALSTRTGINHPLKLGAGTTSLYVAVIVRGTPTYGANADLVFTIGGYVLS